MPESRAACGLPPMAYRYRPQARASQQHGGPDDKEQEQQDRHRHAEQFAAPEETKRRAEPADGFGAGEQVRRTAGDAHHAERDHEGSDLALGDDQAVGQAQERADEQRRGNHERQGPAAVLETGQGPRPGPT